MMAVRAPHHQGEGMAESTKIMKLRPPPIGTDNFSLQTRCQLHTEAGFNNDELTHAS
jgi:hypothetical protein